jgi:hypothetical protein
MVMYFEVSAAASLASVAALTGCGAGAAGKTAAAGAGTVVVITVGAWLVLMVILKFSCSIATSLTPERETNFISS